MESKDMAEAIQGFGKKESLFAGQLNQEKLIVSAQLVPFFYSSPIFCQTAPSCVCGGAL